MANAKIRPRRGTVTQWATVNPILAEGEIGIEFPNTGVGTGKAKIKFGDGKTRCNSLPYAVGEDESTVRYNPENDSIELKAGAEWIVWARAGLEGLFVINNGMLNSDFVFNNIGGTATYTQQNGSVLFSKPAGGSNGLLSSPQGVNTSDYTKLVIDVSNYGDGVNFGLSSKSTSTDVLTSITINKNGINEIDLTSINREVYIYIYFATSNATSVTVTDLHFE